MCWESIHRYALGSHRGFGFPSRAIQSFEGKSIQETALTNWKPWHANFNNHNRAPHYTRGRLVDLLLFDILTSSTTDGNLAGSSRFTPDMKIRRVHQDENGQSAVFGSQSLKVRDVDAGHPTLAFLPSSPSSADLTSLLIVE
jgi:hypothetical protein